MKTNIIKTLLMSTMAVIALSGMAEGKVISCEDISDSVKRLNCIENWKIKIEMSKMDDSTNVQLILFSMDTFLSKYGKRENGLMSVFCKEGQTKLVFTFDGKILDNDGSKALIFRVNKNESF